MRAWMVLDAPNCYERTVRAERKSAPTQNGAPETCMFHACFSTFHAPKSRKFHA